MEVYSIMQNCEKTVNMRKLGENLKKRECFFVANQINNFEDGLI